VASCPKLGRFASQTQWQTLQRTIQLLANSLNQFTVIVTVAGKVVTPSRVMVCQTPSLNVRQLAKKLNKLEVGLKPTFQRITVRFSDSDDQEEDATTFLVGGVPSSKPSKASSGSEL
jgi:hypothetical protein